MQKLSKVPDLAGILKVKDSTVYGWVRAGKIPSLRIGRLIRFTPKQIREISGIGDDEGGSAPADVDSSS
ncbi:MAG: helix-turn-helix domain-containing protein [Acidobacteriia bacterium]|nr:helix-turn-helix domain-containing protein [Terriglobia bacterium]